MPATDNHEAFPQPQNRDGILWRYMDFPKLVSLLTTSKLYLSQLASLNAEDPAEGKLPHYVRKAMVDQWDRRVAPVAQEVCDRSYPVDRAVEMMRATTYVNCWCLQERELATMWRIYGGSSGVAVKTQYGILAESLPAWVFIGQVQYIDYSKSGLPSQNGLSPVMHKRHFFKEEAEFRIVQWLSTNQPNRPPTRDDRTPFDRYPQGVFVPIDLKKAIREVVVSPLVPRWHEECVRAVVERFSPWVKVTQSKMLG